jgi:hypothetical protein
MSRGANTMPQGTRRGARAEGGRFTGTQTLARATRGPPRGGAKTRSKPHQRTRDTGNLYRGVEHTRTPMHPPPPGGRDSTQHNPHMANNAHRTRASRDGAPPRGRPPQLQQPTRTKPEPPPARAGKSPPPAAPRPHHMMEHAHSGRPRHGHVASDCHNNQTTHNTHHHHRG